MTSTFVRNFLVLSCLLGILTTKSALALTGAGVTKVTAFAQARSNNDANFVQFQSTITGCTYNRAYIEFEDREMFAAAVSAAAQKLDVEALIDTGAPSRVMEAHGPNPMVCRVVSFIVKGF